MSRFYFCSISPVNGPMHAHAVATAEEIDALLARGFSVQLLRGPCDSEKAAADELDDFWEFSGNLPD